MDIANAEIALKIAGGTLKTAQKIRGAMREGFGDIAERCRPDGAGFDDLSTLPARVGYKLNICREIAEGVKAAQLAASFDNIVSEATRYLYRIQVVGRFNTGKSSLLNAIFGKDILPVGLLPTTKIPTWIVGGKGDSIFCETKDGQIRCLAPEDLTNNTLDAENIFVSLDHPLLCSGVAIIDTPGLEDPDKERVAITRDAIDSADAIVFVSDIYPLGQQQKDFLSYLVRIEKTRNLFVLFNKVDEIPPEERGDFQKEQVKVLSDLGITANFYTVSAREPDTLKPFISSLEDFIANGVIKVREAAVEKKVDEFFETTRAALENYSRQSEEARKQQRARLAEANRQLEENLDKALRKINYKEESVRLNWKSCLDSMRGDIDRKIDKATADDLKHGDLIANLVQEKTFKFLSQEMEQAAAELQEALQKDLDVYTSIFVDRVDTGVIKNNALLDVPSRLIVPGWVLFSINSGLLAGVKALTFAYFAGPLIEGAISAVLEHFRSASMRNQLKEKLLQAWPEYDDSVCGKIREFFDFFKEEVKKAFEGSPASNNVKESIALLDGIGQLALPKEKIDEYRERMEGADKC
ncbi:MAG: dynamin family protein [Synergistaceae bacterium]|nr:dynamin family protein [Synergistaceae bacterium]